MTTTIANPNNIQAFENNVNVLRALLWQYNKAAKLTELITEKQGWLDENQSGFWKDWYKNVFNLVTANEFGLSVWAQILDLPLFVNTSPDNIATKPTIGFNASFFKNFNRGNFSSITGETQNLPLETKRLALRLKVFQCFCSGTVPETNRFLAYVFESYGKCFVVDNYDMTQTFVFLFPIDANLNFVLQNFDLLPRPAGVENIYKRLSRSDMFGFNASIFTNFNRGNFPQ